MNRQIQRVKISTTIQPIENGFAPDLTGWMVNQATQYGFQYLFAYAANGLTWGHFDSKGLTLSIQIFDELKATWSADTLQQVRLFGENAEMLLYQGQSDWMMRLIKEGEGAETDSLSESYWLWGTRGELGREDRGFTLLVEGNQGLRHAPPITGLSSDDRVALLTRHYINDDANGQARIAFSRLVNLERVPLGGK